MGPGMKRVWSFAAVVAAIIAVLVAGPVFAAEFGSGDIYRLPAGQVIEDDLTVMAQEIYIDGKVDGDLVAMGAYVEINGVVTGDVLAAGAEVRINGVVEDDVRAAGAGVIVTGRIGDHLFAAAGGGEGAFSPAQVSGRSVVQGVRIERGATVGGSAYMFAGEALIDGAVAGDLQAGAGTVILNGQVGGDAALDVGKITIGDSARIGGVLSYTAPEAASVPPGVAGDVRFEQREQPQTTPAPAFRPGQILRPLLMLAGFALLGWLLLRFAPDALRRPAQALALRPGQAALYGIAALALLFAIPLLSILIFLAILLFWGWFPALMFAVLLTAALVLAWTLSPLITGLWAGRALLRAAGREAGDFLALCLGVLLIVLLSLIPWVGWLVGLVSLVLALGALIAARRGAFDVPVTTATPAPTPV
ncbi:MAG: polymer-forming cytoskeletal protein [Oscillochloridaceae bacterium]|nr:polymer-forming cytoskeletal protein [Chloroflexaceae bacterium]MDW8388626.1 polymer-forming cytoskeletal protein [Oscillochloridaceae bacterium]